MVVPSYEALLDFVSRRMLSLVLSKVLNGDSTGHALIPKCRFIEGGSMTKQVAHWHKTTLVTAAIAFLAGLSARPLSAATVYVGSCVANVAQYSTIQAAVNAVHPGSTIRVCSGSYPEQVVINKDLNLTGFDTGTADNPVVVIPSGGFVANTAGLTTAGPIAAQILVAYPATRVTISDLAVDGSNSNLNSGCGEPPLIGVYFQGASGRLDSVAVRNQAQDTANFGCQSSAGFGIFVESGDSENSTVRIENSTIYGYQKNGITADETGTTVTITGSSVVGAGPVDTGQNGIQVAYGATGTIENNILADDDFNGDTSQALATGILIYGSGGMTIRGNSVTNTQTGIVTVTDGSLTANGNQITNNLVTNTHVGDGIDVCSDSNSIFGNTVLSSDDAGIHLDSTCGSTGSSNIVDRNTVNEACAAILQGGSGNSLFLNKYSNVANTILAGDVCTAVTPSAQVKSQLVSKGHTFSPARP